MPSNAEHRIEKALEGLKTRKYLTVAGAARAENIPRTTLRARIAGGLTHAQGAEQLQLLSNEQELLLKSWILQLGHSPTYAGVRAMASFILCGDSMSRIPGKNWLHRYIERHPEVKSKVSVKPDRQRANSFTKRTRNEFFDHVSAISYQKLILVDATTPAKQRSNPSFISSEKLASLVYLASRFRTVGLLAELSLGILQKQPLVLHHHQFGEKQPIATFFIT